MFHDESRPADFRISLAVLETMLFFIGSEKPWVGLSLNVFVIVYKSINNISIEVLKNTWS